MVLVLPTPPLTATTVTHPLTTITLNPQCLLELDPELQAWALGVQPLLEQEQELREVPTQGTMARPISTLSNIMTSQASLLKVDTMADPTLVATTATATVDLSALAATQMKCTRRTLAGAAATVLTTTSMVKVCHSQLEQDLAASLVSNQTAASEPSALAAAALMGTVAGLPFCQTRTQSRTVFWTPTFSATQLLQRVALHLTKLTMPRPTRLAMIKHSRTPVAIVSCK